MMKIDLLEAPSDFSGKGVGRSVPNLSETDDPQIIFRPSAGLQPGWYRFALSMRTDEPANPQLYFDFGGGFNEITSIRLAPTGESHVAKVKLPSVVKAVRLDPTDCPGRFALDGFTAERLAPIRVGLELVVFGAAVLRGNPRGFFSRLPVYLRALAGRKFLRLSDPRTMAHRHTRASYERWIEAHDFQAGRDDVRLEESVKRLKATPMISVLMPVYNTPETLLRAAIDSVLDQIYGHWQLCIADDCSTLPHVRPVLEAYAAGDDRIKLVFRETNGHISHATNSAFDLASGEWIALLDHDDVLPPNALAEVALEIARHPDAQLIYSDEDKLDRKGQRFDPYFKPDFSRELFRSQNYLNHLTVHRAAHIRAVGGWRTGFEGSQDYDLNLRIIERIEAAKIRHIPKVLYHWRAVEGSTASSGSEKSYAYSAGFRALEEHVERMQLPARVETAPDTPFYRLRFAVPKPPPLVSLIIPTRDKVDLLRNCVQSIIGKTTYAPYEIIIVDNGSQEAETLAYLAELKARDNVRVLRYDKPFNYSAINNFAVSKAKGTLIGLVNNDIEVISPDWLSEMVSWAVQDDVGCVGAKLYYANDTIQHAGVILGIGGVANHAHHGLPRHSPGYFGRAVVLSNCSAITGACLVVRKQLYEQVGGLDAKHLAVAFNDVDFSLRIEEAGYHNVWTPYAELYHLESVSRGQDDTAEKKERFGREVDYMMNRWAKELVEESYYSPNLNQSSGDFTIVV